MPTDIADSADKDGGSVNQVDAISVSSDELSAFFQAHFSDLAVAAFGDTFTQIEGNGANDPSNQKHTEQLWEEVDDLGYYDDGVKRTLTDEEIEFFRHSELRDLRRQQEKATKKLKEARDDDLVMDDGLNLDDATSNLEKTALPSNLMTGKKRKKKGNMRPRPEPKPDLRKRTWDVVDKGLDTLDYD